MLSFWEGPGFIKGKGGRGAWLRARRGGSLKEFREPIRDIGFSSPGKQPGKRMKKASLKEWGMKGGTEG